MNWTSAGGWGVGSQRVRKTTLLHLIAGILTPDQGTVWFDGEAFSLLPESQRDRRRGQQMGYVFQTFNLLQGLTALENVLLAQSLGKGQDRPFARALLEEVGLSDQLHNRPGQLSSGQQQRVALARALANRPALVLADEPTAHLDPALGIESMSLLDRLCIENGAALLLVSHDPTVLELMPEQRSLASLSEGNGR
ncbi:MAG: ATP-binding cassette domain-containing protein [Elusimicrobia bacterium]|nr:ATP-binding cassette domain-containing protein [Elusimicrobiota bacterium]